MVVLIKNAVFFFKILFRNIHFFGPYLILLLATPSDAEFTKTTKTGRFSESSNGNKKVNLLNGQHLTIVSLDIRPYMQIEHDIHGKISNADGVIYQMVVWLSKRFNFTFNLVEPKDGGVGALVNNTWNGMIRMAQNREVDLIAGPVIPSGDRALVVDFTTSYLDEPAACLIPAPTLLNNKWNAIFNPFHSDVHSYFCISFTTWLTMNLLYWKCISWSRSKNNYPRTHLSYSDHFISALGVLCSQSRWSPNSPSYSTRITMSAWCLMCTVLIYAYSSCIISYLTIPKSHLLVNSIEELANSNTLQLATLRNSIFETILMQSDSGPFKLLGDSLRKHPENRLTSQYYNQNLLLQKVLENSHRGRFALMTGQLQLEMLIELNYQQTRRCDLTLLPQQFMPLLKTCLALPKGSVYTHLITLGILEMKQLGLVDYWIRFYLKQTNRCDREMNAFGQTLSEEKLPLALLNLMSTFFLLLMGMTLSTFVFTVETCLIFPRRNPHGT